MSDYILVEELIIDPRAKAAIVRQNSKLYSSEELPYSIKQDIFKSVDSCLKKHNVSVYKHYGDLFMKSQMIKTKYIINETLSHAQAIEILYDLKDTLSEEFNLKEISYLIQGNEHFIVIWM